MVSVDFFTVPTIRLRVLFVFLVLAHRRREVLHFNVTDHPTSVWVAQQMVEACADRDAALGDGWILVTRGVAVHAANLPRPVRRIVRRSTAEFGEAVGALGAAARGEREHRADTEREESERSIEDDTTEFHLTASSVRRLDRPRR